MTREPDRWAAALSLAARLGVPPQAFWRLSLVEWRAVTAGLDGPRAPSRAELEALMRAYPDTE